jgi:hypothetical protein
MVQLPSGKVLLFITVDSDSATQIVAYASDDDGATWSSWSPACLNSPISTSVAGYAVGDITAAYLNGQISLFVEVRSTDTTKGAAYMHDTLAQYASIDNGGTFEAVGTLAVSGTTYYDAGIAGGRPSVVAFNGEFLLVWSAWTGTVMALRYARLSTAFDDYSTAPGADIGFLAGPTRFGEVSIPGGGTSYQLDDADVTTCVHRGEAYAYVRDSADGQGYVTRTRTSTSWSQAFYYEGGSPSM